MPIKRRYQFHLESQHFLLLFWICTAILYGGRLIVNACCENEDDDQTAVAETEKIYNNSKDKIESNATSHKHQGVHAKQDNIIPDSIEEARRNVDRLFFCPRRPLAFLSADGTMIRNKISRLDVPNLFNDLNDVQLATASVIGVPECETRDDIKTDGTRYVYIGDSPYYDIEELTYSVPYLIPRAAILLDEIGHAFLDSLTAKGIPFHKLAVTSVLRTNEDVARLTRFNANASENSCHRFGTTFDIAYSTFYRVSDPDGDKQVEWSARELMPILAEVLNDQHNLGTCYIKHEVRKRCFHITSR